MNLYEQHENLIKVMAGAYKKRWGNVDYDDLYQVASIALWQAEVKYDDTKGEFKNYALKQMKCRILKYLYRQNQLHTPKNIIDVAVTIKRLGLENESPEAISEYIHKDLLEIHNALLHLKVNSVENFHSVDEVDGSLGWNDTSDEAVVNVDFQQFTKSLNDKELLILDAYQEVKSTVKLASRIGVTQSQASRLLSKIKSKYYTYSDVEREYVNE